MEKTKSDVGIDEYTVVGGVVEEMTSRIEGPFESDSAPCV